MMKSEFEKLMAEDGRFITLGEEYDIIERVYTYHPAIKDKRHIAKLYLEFGMSVIKDMLPRADKCADLEIEIQKQTVILENLKDALKDLHS